MTILQFATEKHLGWLTPLYLPILRRQWLPKQRVVKFRETSLRRG